MEYQIARLDRAESACLHCHCCLHVHPSAAHGSGPVTPSWPLISSPVYTASLLVQFFPQQPERDAGADASLDQPFDEFLNFVAHVKLSRQLPPQHFADDVFLGPRTRRHDICAGTARTVVTSQLLFVLSQLCSATICHNAACKRDSATKQLLKSRQREVIPLKLVMRMRSRMISTMLLPGF